MATTRGSRSRSGASAVDEAGGGQQGGSSMDVDPSTNTIDVDKDHDQTQGENQVRGCGSEVVRS